MKLVAATCCTGGYECKSAFQVAVQQCGACVAGINCQRSHLDRSSFPLFLASSYNFGFSFVFLTTEFMNLRVKLTMQSCFSCANYNRSQKAWDTLHFCQYMVFWFPPPPYPRHSVTLIHLI